MPVRDVIIVKGKAVRCAAPVHSWRDTGFHFLGITPRLKTRFVVNHWTASENSAADVYRHMAGHLSETGKAQPLSVHFIVDQAGAVYQCADADIRCAHAKERGGNTEGVGIEFINRGDGRAPEKGVLREPRTETIHGATVRYGAMTEAQEAAAIALNRALCTAYGLPMVCPLKGADIYPTVLPPPLLARFRGVLGHLHLDYGKRDPGLDLLRAIHAAGVAPPGAVA